MFSRLKFLAFSIFEPNARGGERGFSVKPANIISAIICRPFVQDNLSRSARGVLLGLRVQMPQSARQIGDCVAWSGT